MKIDLVFKFNFSITRSGNDLMHNLPNHELSSVVINFFFIIIFFKITLFQLIVTNNVKQHKTHVTTNNILLTFDGNQSITFLMYFFGGEFSRYGDNKNIEYIFKQICHDYH